MNSNLVLLLVGSMLMLVHLLFFTDSREKASRPLYRFFFRLGFLEVSFAFIELFIVSRKHMALYHTIGETFWMYLFFLVVNWRLSLRVLNLLVHLIMWRKYKKEKETFGEFLERMMPKKCFNKECDYLE